MGPRLVVANLELRSDFGLNNVRPDSKTGPIYKLVHQFMDSVFFFDDESMNWCTDP
jgi:hypothetical protein